MLYQLRDGSQIDTARQCTFEERNFLQKMIIHAHLKMEPQRFRRLWQGDGNPVWQGPSSLERPSAALRILLDLQAKLEETP